MKSREGYLGSAVMLGLICALAGAALAPVIFGLVFVLEFANCLMCGFPGSFCIGGYAHESNNYINLACRSCLNFGCALGSGCFPMWNAIYLRNTALILALAGGIIGSIFGISVQKSTNKEKELNKSAEAGNSQAQLTLGKLYLNSSDYTKREKAYDWISIASANGHEEAMKLKADIDRQRELEQKQKESQGTPLGSNRYIHNSDAWTDSPRKHFPSDARASLNRAADRLTGRR